MHQCTSLMPVLYWRCVSLTDKHSFQKGNKVHCREILDKGWWENKTRENPSYGTTFSFSCTHEIPPHRLEAIQTWFGVTKSTVSLQNHYLPQVRDFMLSKLEKAWAGCDSFAWFFGQNRGISIPQYSHIHLLSHMGFWMSLWSEKGRKCSLWRKEQKESRMGTAEQVPLLAKLPCLPDGGKRELITFLWEELHSQILTRCFKSLALWNCHVLFYPLLFSTEAPFSEEIDYLEIGRKYPCWGQDWRTFVGI